MYSLGSAIVLLSAVTGSVAQLTTSPSTRTTTSTTSSSTNFSLSIPTDTPSSSLMICPASMRCDEKVYLGELLVEPCKFPSTECNCVAFNSTRFANCLKEVCPDKWEATRNSKLKTCKDVLNVDLSGNTTYTGSMPTFTGNSTIFGIAPAEKPDGLSQSDKIAIGIGVGFGVPTLAVGLGTWLCARTRRRRKAERALEEDDQEDSELKGNNHNSEQPTPDNTRQVPDVEGGGHRRDNDGMGMGLHQADPR